MGAPLEKYAMNFDLLEAGQRAFRLPEELFPLCRSLTGDGVRQTLKILQRSLPLEIHEVPSGAAAYDWNVPHEWNVRDAYVRDLRGQRVIDFRASNLQLVGYSIPFRGIVTKEELLAHLYSDPAHPDRVPYRHTYSKKSWGFCVAYYLLQSLSDEQYEVCIDTSMEPGPLTYGELVIPGHSVEEILISTHTCHPSLSNDNLSGIVVATVLASCLMKEREH